MSHLNHVLTLLVPLSFLVFRLGSVDGKRSGRSGLDPSYMGLKELEQASLRLPL